MSYTCYGKQSNDSVKMKCLKYIGMIELKSIYRYRILLLLLAQKTYTQVRLATIFEIPK